MHVTNVPFVSQWAEMTMIAFGLGKFLPKCARLRVKLLSRTMFIGDPWPMNRTVILSYTRIFYIRHNVITGRLYRLPTAYAAR